MNNDIYSQGQFEFFASPSRLVTNASKRQFTFRSLNVSMDNLVVASIVLVMLLLVVFSLGVERGKGIASGIPVEKNTVQNVENGVSLQTSPTVLSSESDVETISLPADDGPEVNVQQAMTEPVEANKTADEGYTIQVASYKGEKYARETVEKLQKLGHESFFLSKGEYVIVCVGKFSLMNEAKKYSMELKKKYKDCYVRRI